MKQYKEKDNYNKCESMFLDTFCFLVILALLELLQQESNSTEEKDNCIYTSLYYFMHLE